MRIGLAQKSVLAALARAVLLTPPGSVFFSSILAVVVVFFLYKKPQCFLFPPNKQKGAKNEQGEPILNARVGMTEAAYDEALEKATELIRSGKLTSCSVLLCFFFKKFN